MKRTVLTILALLLFSSFATALTSFDSVSIEPGYIERGMDVDIFVKFHEGLSKRGVYSTQTKDGERIPQSTSSQEYYVAQLIAKNQATEKYILVKQGERNVGMLSTGESWTTPFSIHVADDAIPTNYTLTFLLKKTNADGTKTPEIILSQDLQIRVRGKPKFNVNSDSKINAGETSQFQLSLGNVGGGLARHASVKLNATSPITVLKSSTQFAGDMSGTTFKDLIYEVNVDVEAKPGAYSIPIEITYTDRDGNDVAIADILGVRILGKPVVDATIDETENLAEGKEGKITVGVVNKGFVDAKFLSVSVVDSEQVEVSSNPDIYIGNIASDDFETEDFSVKFKEGTSGKVPVKVKLSYTREDNNERVDQIHELIVQVMSKQDYELANPEVDPQQQLIEYAMLIPVLILAYLAIWILWKIMGAITGLIDRKIFRRS